MRTRITLIICLCLFAVGRASAQWAVIDPSNIAQSIVNTSKNVVHTSTTAQNMIKNFQETVKIYEQGKKYYDALKSVNNLVKDARKVQQTILMVGDITDTYVTSFQKMMRDDNFTVEEHRLWLHQVIGGIQRCADGTEECGEYHHALHDGQGAHGRGGTLLLQNEALPQPRELLHQQEH